jgi:hypothetical protein
MKDWLPYEHHKRVVSWAKQARCPLLTTNFDKTFSEAGDCKLLHTRRDGFTDYYPWETYYGHQQFDDPCHGFAIWHINGMERYPRSIRLGLSHYMGSVQRARDWLHRGNERRLFSGKDIHNWRGFGTWLHIMFDKRLVILGLGLKEDEVFLRWLLIERARYFRKFPAIEPCVKEREAAHCLTVLMVTPAMGFAGSRRPAQRSSWPCSTEAGSVEKMPLLC